MKTICKSILIFIITASLLLSLYVAVAMIPREGIHANMEKSAVHLAGKNAAFPSYVNGLRCSGMDYYADAVLLCIAYYLDPEHPLKSVAESRYYADRENQYNSFVTDYFPKAMKEQPPANQQYMRYWHGSIVLAKPLHLFLSLPGIYIFLGILLALEMAWLTILLLRSALRVEALAFLAAMLSVSIWFVPCCLEYLWMFLLSTALSIIVVHHSTRITRMQRTGPDHSTAPLPDFRSFFLVAGMVTIFLDFFTTETMTLAIPLLFLLRIYRRQDQQGTLCNEALEHPYGNDGHLRENNAHPAKSDAHPAVSDEHCDVNGAHTARNAARPAKSDAHPDHTKKGPWKMVLTNCALWASGYIGMWMLKWALASFTLGRSAMPYVRNSIVEHLEAEPGMTLLSIRLKAIERCITLLFPLEYGLPGAVLLLLLIAVFFFIPVMTGRLALRKNISRKWIGLYAFIGMIPYLRIFVIGNHSMVHAWFVYRAQAASVMALFFVLAEILEFLPAGRPKVPGSDLKRLQTPS